MLLLSRDNYKNLYAIKDPTARLHFNDAAYNGGLGGVNSDRRLCGLKAGCNPQLWFGHVETTCGKSKKILYGNRNACDINRHHVHDVFNNRSNKYKIFMK
jgi:membrane-bound lytic murein transglycosylase MltF